MTFTHAVSPTDLTHQFARLRAVYALAGASGYKDDPQTFTSEWYNVLKGFRRDELSDAVGRWIDGDKAYWPKPGELKRFIFEARGNRNAERVQESYGGEVSIPTGWFAYPPTLKDVEGPRYRQHTLDVAQRQGMLPIEQVECPIEGCSCYAVEVWYGPEHHGMSTKFFNAKALGGKRPRGWKWTHYALEKKMSPCNQVSPSDA